MTQDSKESALSRWSRRKLEAQEAETQPPAAGDTASVVETPAVAAEDEKQVLTDADMPDIDSLDEESDFSPFMSAGVSDELRNLALRKLFRSSVFNIRDGLDEYDEDYTTFEKLGDIVTADMKHQIEMQEQKLREKLAAEAEVDTAEAQLDEIDEIEEEIDDLGEEAAQTDTVADAGEEIPPREET